jgi:hypothetical protein
MRTHHFSSNGCNAAGQACSAAHGIRQELRSDKRGSSADASDNETRADDSARERRRPSFFHIKKIGTAQIVRPDFGGSLRPAA